MISNRFHVLRSLVAVALLATAVTSAQAAFPLRAPQIVVNPGDGALQGYFNGLGETITVATDQLDAQTWSTAISGNSTLTLMLEIAGYAGSNSMGRGPANRRQMGQPAGPWRRLWVSQRNELGLGAFVGSSIRVRGR